MSVANEPDDVYRPCLVLAHPDAVYATETCRRFRRQGWDVYQTHGGPEARRLARMLEPHLVVLGVDLDGESGFLTCAKLKRELPAVKVILVSEDAGPRSCSMAVFVGATLVRRQDCVASLVAAPPKPPMPAAS
jgi:DNA-binding response OmpR family regulator